MDNNIKDKILGRPRARELAKWKPPEPSIKQLREQLAGPGVSDDDLLLRYFSSEKDVAAMKASGPPAIYLSVRHPLLTLLESLIKADNRRQVYIRAGEASLRLEKRKPRTVA